MVLRLCEPGLARDPISARRADLVIEKNDLGSPGNAGCCEADYRLFLPSTVGNALLRQIVIYPARH